jgi:hypothetical protein
MISTKPSWTFFAKHSLTQWYGYVHLLPDVAVGQWLVLDRQTGRPLWERGFHRPNSIFGIAGDVILATERRSDGPWTLDFGCYAIALRTGELLWQWHGPGIWGAFVRACDWIPGFTNELRPSFRALRGNECLITSRRVLDVETGRTLRRNESREEWKGPDLLSDAKRLYRKMPVAIEPGRTLSLVPPEEKGNARERSTSRKIVVQVTDEAGAVVWCWGPHMIGLHSKTNYYGWRLAGDRLLFLAGEEPEVLPHSTHKGWVVTNSTRYHLIVVDVRNGEVLQRFPVCEGPTRDCRIEDVDEKGVLISPEFKRLDYYEMLHASAIK